MTTAIFYTSKCKHGEDVAKKISKEFGDIRIFDIAVTGSEYINDFKHIIFGVPTANNGQMQQDWQEIWSDFKKTNFKNKTVAIFGLGDQVKYPNEFADAMKYVYDDLVKSGAIIVGFTNIDSYDFKDSKAVIDNKFVGLVIDEINQPQLTDERIKLWVEQIKDDIEHESS